MNYVSCFEVTLLYVGDYIRFAYLAHELERIKKKDEFYQISALTWGVFTLNHEFRNASIAYGIKALHFTNQLSCMNLSLFLKFPL